MTTALLRPPRPGHARVRRPVPLGPLRPLLRRLGRRPSWLVAATVLATAVPPGPRPPGGGAPTVADAVSGVLVVAVVALAVARRRALPSRAPLAFGPLVVAAGVTTLASQDVAASLPGFVRTVQIFVLVPLAVVLAVRDRRDVAVIGGSVVVTALGESVFGLWQSASGHGASYGGRPVRAVGTFGSLDVMALSTLASFGVLVVVAFALAGSRRARWAAVPALAVLLAALAAGLSRGTWIALAAAVAVLLLLWDRRALIAAAVGSVALAVVLVGGFGIGADLVGQRLRSIASSVDAPDRSVSDRYGLWGTARDIWAAHPVTGVGPKNFAAFRDTYAPLDLSSGAETADEVNGYVRQPLLSPHNEYLLLLSEQGLLGLGGFAVLGAALARGLWRNRELGRAVDAGWWLSAGFLAWLAVDFVYSDLGGPTSVLVGVLLGLATVRALTPPGENR
ncbi:O-antigen ligase family protein [Actinomadura rayongensis]|uniref:O-antigen ligase domain-containing protein n=1 Tax=Actinomadura rayongensis TaxID=1429076 RepID=A0A6I4W6V7_9ACTN|nr:O-antigen ligase family protein [Actinomadura rayongensis]MXQ65298.1 O-antigen ligase domain-containing protein [Actinomadura rayongensis]